MRTAFLHREAREGNTNRGRLARRLNSGPRGYMPEQVVPGVLAVDMTDTALQCGTGYMQFGYSRPFWEGGVVTEGCGGGQDAATMSEKVQVTAFQSRERRGFEAGPEDLAMPSSSSEPDSPMARALAASRAGVCLLRILPDVYALAHG